MGNHIFVSCAIYTRHTTRPQTFFSSVTLPQPHIVLYIMKRGNADLFLALQSACRNGALVTAFFSDHLTHAQAVGFKDPGLSLAGRCDGAVKEGE